MSNQQIRVVLTGESAGLEAAGSRGARTLDNLVRSSGNAQRSLTQLGAASASTSRQAALLIPQLNDIGVSLAGGQSPMLVFLQQGLQIRDVMGGWRQAGTALMGMLSAKAVVIGGLVSTVGLLAKAYLDGEAQSERFRDAVSRSGNAAGITEGQFNSLVERTATLANTTQSTTRGIAEALVASGRVGRDALEPMTVAIARVAEVSDRSTSDVTADFLAMSKGVGDWAVKYNESANFITAAQLRVVRAMEDADDKQGAMIRVNELVIGAHKRQAEQLGFLETAWRGWGQAIDWVWQKLMGAGRGASISDQFVAQAEKVRQAALDLADAERNGRLAGVTAERRGVLASEQAKLQNIGARLQLEDVAARSQARQASTNAAQIAADEKARADRIAASKRAPRSQDSIDAEYQRMVRDTVANRPTRLADINAADYESIAKYERDQMVAAARASQQATAEAERNRQRAIDQAAQMGEQLADQASGINAQLITDDARRADAQIEIERQTIQRRIDMLAAAGADVRTLEDGLAQYMVARRAEAAEALKPQWQKMLEGYRDTNRLMRESWDDLNLQIVQGGEQAWIDLIRTTKVSAGQLVDMVLNEFLRLQYRQQIAPLLGQALGSIGSFIGIPGLGSSIGSGAGTVTGGSGFRFNALGNAYSGLPSLSAYSGQVVNRPTMFAFARGAGVMGEAGYEGIFPLKRNSRGQLGVMAAGAGQGGGGTQVYVSVENRTDAQVQTTTEKGPNGEQFVKFIIERAAAEVDGRIVSGGSTSRAMRAAFGLQPQTLARR